MTSLDGAEWRRVMEEMAEQDLQLLKSFLCKMDETFDQFKNSEDYHALFETLQLLFQQLEEDDWYQPDLEEFKLFNDYLNGSPHTTIQQKLRIIKSIMSYIKKKHFI